MSDAGRFWCFTIPNPKRLLDFDELHEQLPCITYGIYSEEVSSETGLYHFQGYVELSRTQRLSYVRRICEAGHYEIRRGTQEEAINYCIKSDTHVGGPYEWGTRSAGQGARIDIDKFRKDIESGKNIRELAEDHLSYFLRYPNGAKWLIDILQPRKPRSPLVIWLFGPPGTGKTLSVFERYDRVYQKPHSRWWDGYDGEDVVLLDDFIGWLPFHELLQLLDRYDYRGEIKGHFVRPNPSKIIITSNAFPSTVYKDPKLPWEALLRRVHEWWYCGTDLWKKFNSYSDFARFCGRSDGDFGVRSE